MVPNGCNCYFLFWAIFCPFTSLIVGKIKTKEKLKKHLEISSLYNSVPKIRIIRYTFPEIWHITDPCNYFSLWACFCLYLPYSPKNQNSKKMKNRPGDIIILHKCSKNHDHMLYCSWGMVHDRCNCYFSFWAIFCPFTSLIARKIKI